MQSAPSDAARRHMIDSQLRTSGITTPWIVAAIGAIPREAFLPADKAAFAYQDRSVPLGNGRFLNPPLATAQMLQSAEVMPTDRVLIIGAGNGYMAALLRGRAERIVAVESDAALFEMAQVGVTGVEHVHGPLSGGAPDHGPYTLILIDGAIEQLPDAIAAQLADGGRIVTGLSDGAVRRLAMGIKHGGQIVLRPFADMEVAPLPGFEKKREFVF